MNRLLQTLRYSRIGPEIENFLRRRDWLWAGLQGLRKRTLYDVFGRRTGKRAMLSYVTAAFTEPKDTVKYLRHSNLWECREIARIFDQFGYVVDVTDCVGPTPRLRYCYDLWFETGFHLERVAPQLPSVCRKIAYATGRHWLTHNAAEYKRLRELLGRRGFALTPRRITPPLKCVEVADALLYLGNDLVLNSYNFCRLPAYQVRASCPELLNDNAPKDWNSARRRYLWLGGGGMVLKGLDLLLEVFANLPELELFVVGPVDAEEDFVRAFRQELRHTSNIHTYGYINAASDDFARIAQNCAALVYPSASEGTPGAVLSAMAVGLVPIISRECCLDLGDAGIVLKDCTVATIRNEVLRLTAMPDTELSLRSRKAREFVVREHNRGEFSRTMQQALRNALNVADAHGARV